METKSTKDYVNQTLTQTKTAITKLLDAVDIIDRKIYGRKMKLFVWGCVLVLVVAPLLDIGLEVPHHRLTYFSTLAFLFFLLLLILAFVGSWRDDTGNWTWARAKSRLRTYYEITKDRFEATRTNPRDENFYRVALSLLFIAIAWKALQNLSVFVRKPLETIFHAEMNGLRDFETLTLYCFWLPLIGGMGTMAYLYRQNPQILIRIQGELRQLFGWGIANKYAGYSSFTKLRSEDYLVIHAKRDEHVATVRSANTSQLFNDFVTALQNWNPRNAQNEYQFQDRLYRHLRKWIPEATVAMECPIGDRSLPNKGRADMVINDSILIEMKRDSSAGAIQRAKGQMSQYTEIWKEKGPVILLLCNYDYEHARLAFTSTMVDLAKLKRPAMTIVATELN